MLASSAQYLERQLWDPAGFGALSDMQAESSFLEIQDDTLVKLCS